MGLQLPVRCLTGQQIGEYLVGELIGIGGTGQVYEARHPVIDKRVAIKVLTAERCADAGNVARFIAEARAVNAIRHRNIVDVFAFGELPDRSHYLVMEYLEGIAFDRLIATRSPVPAAEALIYIEEVLEALAAAHEAGVVHRDVKPSNVFLVQPRRGRPYVKLLDFGAAKLGAAREGLTATSRASQVIGTPTYMAPEQALGLPIGPSSDLYAVGGLLFELLTGRVVFPSTTPFESMRRHTQEAPQKPSEVVPTLPRAVDEIVEALLRKEPVQRPQSADAVRRWAEAIRLMVSALEAPMVQLPSSRVTPPPAAIEAVALSLASSPATEPQLPLRGTLTLQGSKRPVALLAVSVAIMVSAGVAGLSSRGQASPLNAPPAPVIVPLPPPAAPAPVLASPPPAPVAPVEVLPALPQKPAPKPHAAARPALAADAALTDDMLRARKSGLEGRLAEREQLAGEPDRVVRRLLAGVDLQGARDEGTRRIAWNRLEEIGRQLDGR